MKATGGSGTSSSPSPSPSYQSTADLQQHVIMYLGGRTGTLQSPTETRPTTFTALTTDVTNWTRGNDLAAAVAFPAFVRHDSLGAFLFGGQDSNGSPLDLAVRMPGDNPVPTTLAALSNSRGRAAAAYFQGSIYLLGGVTSQGVTRQYLKSADGTSWLEEGQLPGERALGSAVVMGSNLYYIAGTANADFTSPQSTVFQTSDGVTWTSIGKGDFGNRLGASTATLGSFVYICGGYDGENVISTCYTSTDLITWNRTTTGLPEARAFGVMVSVSERLWYLGGVDSSQSASDAVYVSSSDGSTWARAGRLPEPSFGGAAVGF